MNYLKRKTGTIIVCLTLIVAALFAGCDWFNASARVEKQLELGVKYLSESKYEEAVLAYREVIKIDKKSVPAYKGLSVAYTLQEKPEQAEQALQDGLKQVTGSKPLKIALAGLFVDWNKKDQAEAVYNEIITLDGNYLPAYQAYARLLVGLNRQNDAVALLEKAAAGNAGQYIIYNLLAEQHIKSGSGEKALSVISQSLSAEPNQAGPYKLLVEIYSGRWADLIALGDQYIQQGRNMSGQIIKLTGLYQSGKYDDMLKLFDQLPSDLKASPKARLLAAQAYVKLGQKDQGVNLVKDIKPESIKDAALLAEIANFCLEAGDKETARSLALQGISLDDTVIDNYIVLSKSYQDEDKSQSDIWQTKYLLGSAFSIKETQITENKLFIKEETLLVATDVGTGKPVDAQLPANARSEVTQDMSSEPLIGYKTDEELALQAAANYFRSEGCDVVPVNPYGNPRYGQYCISIENIWDNNAVIQFGIYCSEYYLEAGVSKQEDGSWKVSYIDDDHILYGEEEAEKNIKSCISSEDGFDITGKPGGYKIGFKSFDKGKAVVLVAPYGEHWSWEYIMQEVSGKWYIVAKGDTNEPQFLSSNYH